MEMTRAGRLIPTRTQYFSRMSKLSSISLIIIRLFTINYVNNHCYALYLQIVFEGVRGNRWQGDIAIDDLKIVDYGGGGGGGGGGGNGCGELFKTSRF